jgi:hypothetical protein
MCKEAGVLNIKLDKPLQQVALSLGQAMWNGSVGPTTQCTQAFWRKYALHDLLHRRGISILLFP